MNNARDTFGELRGRFDGQDPFMTGGHQIIKTRRIERVTPEWARSNKKIQAILLRSFPKLKTDFHQRVRAARWATVIQLYFRVHMTRGQIAEQMKVPLKTVENLIDRIHRACNGMKTSGKGPLSSRPPGRPKKQ